MAGGWESLGLLPELVQTCEEDFDWILPSAIQDEAIPLLLGGGDVMGSAETGSGKTAAFALPILQLCVEHKEQDRKKASQKPPPDKDKNNDKAKEKPPPPKQLNFSMSAQDRDSSIAFHPNGNGLRLQSKDKSRWAGCRCASGMKLQGNKGYSFECTVLDKDGIVRVGWSTEDASLQLGTDPNGYGWGGTGMKSNNGNYDPFPSKSNKVAFTKGDVVGCHLQVSGGGGAAAVSFSKNGELLGDAFEVNKKTKVLYPTICLKNTECELNMGQTKFKHNPPKGFQAVSKVAADSAVGNPKEALAAQLSQQKSSDRKGPLAIVIEPTRDLAEQSYRAFVDLGKRLQDPPVQAALLVGGIKPTETVKMLQQNSVDVLVGTPPIIASYVKKKTIQPTRCRHFVLDEADELISTDSVDHIKSVFGSLVASTQASSKFDRLQVCFFSATLHSKEVRDLADALCHKPLWVDLRGQNDSILPETVHHCVVNIAPDSKPLNDNDDLIETDATHRKGNLGGKIQLNRMEGGKPARDSECIKQFKPRVVLDVMEKFSMEQVLVFCRTNLDCDLMEKFLKKTGGAGGMGMSDKYSCRVLAGMRSMQERQESLEAFKEGEVRILICTDVAARGIDIKMLPFVINCTLPDKPEIYVHRVGRVGRADRMGLAVSLVSTVKERVWFCKKGNKPPCTDTRDFSKGGNCIWYDEPKCLSEIEKLLRTNQVAMTKMDWPSLNLPPAIKEIVQNKGYGEHAKSGGSLNPEVKAKMEKIEGQVKQLTITETSLQMDYWSLRNRFSGRSNMQISEKMELDEMHNQRRRQEEEATKKILDSFRSQEQESKPKQGKQPKGTKSITPRTQNQCGSSGRASAGKPAAKRPQHTSNPSTNKRQRVPQPQTQARHGASKRNNAQQGSSHGASKRNNAQQGSSPRPQPAAKPNVNKRRRAQSLEPQGHRQTFQRNIVQQKSPRRHQSAPRPKTNERNNAPVQEFVITFNTGEPKKKGRRRRR